MADSKVAPTETISDSINKMDLCSKQEAETLRPETSNDGSATLQETTRANTNQTAKSTLSLDTPAADMSIEASLKSSVDGSITACNVVQTTPSTHEVSYTPQIRGRHQLSVSVNKCEVATKEIFVHHPPTQLGTPVSVIESLCTPLGICINKDRDVYATCFGSVSKFTKSGDLILTIGEDDKGPFEDTALYGVAIGKDGSIYITSEFVLYKLNKKGEIIKTINCGPGGPGIRQSVFHCARLIRLHNDQLYLCDRSKQLIHMFDEDLKILTSYGHQRLAYPTGIDFDEQGNSYVADHKASRVVVFDRNHQFLREFSSRVSEENEDEDVDGPWAICVFGGHVYVSDTDCHCVSVFLLSGQFVCSFGEDGDSEFVHPYGIVMDSDGFCFVCHDDGIAVF